MLVRSYVTLSVPAEERHLKTAREAAESLTTDKTAVTVEVPKENPKLIVTTFPMKRGRQMDVSDRVMDAFSMDMEDYSDQGVGFPKSEAEERRDRRKLERAKERRRERRAMERKESNCSREIPYEVKLLSRQIEELIRPMGFNDFQRTQFFVLFQFALLGRTFANLGHASLAQNEANRIYELAHEFSLPKDLYAHDDGFYRGRVYELVRFAEIQYSAAGLPIDVVSPRRVKATDLVTALQNFHDMLLDSCDGSDLEGSFSK